MGDAPNRPRPLKQWICGAGHGNNASAFETGETAVKRAFELGWVLVLCATAAVGLWGCDDESTATPTPADAAVDGGGAQDGGPDQGVDADGGAADMAPPAVACTYPADCPAGDCIDGLCEFEVPARCLGDDSSLCAAGEVCGGFYNDYYCFTECELAESCPFRPRPCAGNPDCPTRMSCHDGRCINSCTTDADCPTGGYCFQGECRPFPADVGGGLPATDLVPGDDGLYAGVAVRPLNFPVGVSAAGYGGRPGPTTPYAFALGGSQAVHDRQDVRAVVLAKGADTVVLLRLPLSWSTDFMLTLITEKVRRATIDADRPDGLDISGRLVTFATHSHSQPGRFWNMVPETGFGAFGYGLFSPEMIDRYTTSFAETVVAALADLSPARAGWTVLDDIDPNGRIHGDRRSESPPFMDDRMMVLRVDDRDGVPRAAIVNLAIHGTHMETEWITGDVAAGIELVATDHLSAQVGRPVPVLFANGNAGNISPRGDDLSNADHAKVQVVGHRVWPIFRDAFNGITTEADPALEVVTHRIPISYELMGYDITVPEFRDRTDDPQIYGAFQCVPDSRDADEPSYVDGALRCRINLAEFLGAPVVQLHKSVLSAFRVGELIVNTLPGEPTSELGVSLTELVEADAQAAGWANARAVQFGYAQDHHLYLLTPDDWFRGGYEASQNVWGWKLGPYLVAQARLTAAELFTEAREDTASPILPTWWPNLVDDTVVPTPSPEAGRIVDDLSDAPRGAMQVLRWIGGHPGADQPKAWLEQQSDAGGWVQGLRPGTQLPFDDTGFESLIVYDGDYAEAHGWSVRWELPFSLPLGTWRIVVEGHTADGEARTPYRIESAPFAVQRAQLVARGVTVEGGTLALKVNYPDGPLNADDGGVWQIQPQSHWLRIDSERAARGVPGDVQRWALALGPPLLIDAPVTVQIDDGEAIETTAHDDEVQRTLRVARDEAGAESTPSFTWFSSRVEVPAPGPGEHQVTITDRWGNGVTLAVQGE